MNSLSRPNKY